jgi:hypothetical protein
MKKYILFLFVITLVFITTHAAFTYSASAPPAGLTNAPGENSCTNCHSTFPLVTIGSSWDSITLTSSVPLSSFLPNTTYVLSLSFTDANSAKYGFEMTALEAGATALSPSIGTFTDSTLETTIQTQGSRDYISHSALGTSAVGNTKTWLFYYTTPTSFSGGIQFYVTVNSTNEDGSSAGDKIFAKVFSSTVLPVKWISQSVKTANQLNIIEWTTASEINNDRFEIEKSENAIQWFTIGSVKGKGNSNQHNHYSFKDINNKNLTSYYRIKQVDFDGKFDYSKVFSTQKAIVTEKVRYDSQTGIMYIEQLGFNNPTILTNLDGLTIATYVKSDEVNVSTIPKGIYILQLPSSTFQKIFIY